VSFPKAISTTGIGCAGASSARNVWAFAGTSSVGSGATAAGALRLVSGRWKLVKSFAGIVTGCLVEGPTEVWVFGDAHVARGTGTWHLHGHTWTHLPFKGFVLSGASAIGANDVWGDGETGFSAPVVGYFLPGAVRGGDGSWWSFLQVDPFGQLPSGVRHLVQAIG
jgi:hypothetical protein